MIGYCIGGTLLSATLAYMAEIGDKRVKAATFFASQTDFSEAGELKIFTDEAQVDNLEQMMSEKGYLEGSAMATTFNMLRANDLIWSFYVDNYLLGKEPLKFDLLYWNADSTRMPRETHLFYLREMYIKNNLSTPGGITLKGVPIDLSKITIPIYIQAAKEDHIAPYQSVFKSTGFYSGPVRFMLAGSGHIAGVINPPAANKYNHWINEEQPKDLNTWIETAEERPGSWWNDWDKWLKKHSGTKVVARIPGDAELTVIEDAPGSYVSVKS
jgi:polyhydroxyalkanoate synthase